MLHSTIAFPGRIEDSAQSRHRTLLAGTKNDDNCLRSPVISQLDPLTWSVFALLGVSLALTMVRWTANQKVADRSSLLIFLGSFMLGLQSESVSPVAAFPIAFMVLSAWLYRSSYWARWAGLVGMAINAGLVFTHQYSGFHNLVAISEMLVSQDALPYTRYLNFDKAAFAWSVLQFAGIRKPTMRQLVQGMVQLLPILFLAPAVLFAAAHVLGYVRLDPKLGDYLWIWLPTNLLFTCVAEELVFRELFLGRAEKINAVLAMVVVSSALFGTAHFAGGWEYMILATVAGGFYALAYLRTGRFVVFSVLTHFWINLLHILLFTYPALAR